MLCDTRNVKKYKRYEYGEYEEKERQTDRQKVMRKTIEGRKQKAKR